jgi:hypothetical protein
MFRSPAPPQGGMGSMSASGEEPCGSAALLPTPPAAVSRDFLCGVRSLMAALMPHRAPVSPAPSLDVAPSLPDGWTEHADAQGRLFFAHARTRVRSRTRPADSSTASLLAHAKLLKSQSSAVKAAWAFAAQVAACAFGAVDDASTALLTMHVDARVPLAWRHAAGGPYHVHVLEADDAHAAALRTAYSDAGEDHVSIYAHNVLERPLFARAADGRTIDLPRPWGRPVDKVALWAPLMPLADSMQALVSVLRSAAALGHEHATVLVLGLDEDGALQVCRAARSDEALPQGSASHGSRGSSTDPDAHCCVSSRCHPSGAGPAGLTPRAFDWGLAPLWRGGTLWGVRHGGSSPVVLSRRACTARLVLQSRSCGMMAQACSAASLVCNMSMNVEVMVREALAGRAPFSERLNPSAFPRELTPSQWAELRLWRVWVCTRHGAAEAL